MRPRGRRCRAGRGGCRDGRRAVPAQRDRASVAIAGLPRAGEGAGERTHACCLVGQRSLDSMLRIPTAARPESRGIASPRSRPATPRRSPGPRARRSRAVGRPGDRAAGDPASIVTVRDDRVATLRHEPETPVLENEDRRASLRRQLRRRCRSQLDRRRRIVVGADLLRRSVRGRGEQTGVDRPDEPRGRRGGLRLALSALAARCKRPACRVRRPTPWYQSRMASPQNSATTPPSARNGPSGIADPRASLPCRARREPRPGRMRRRSRRTWRRSRRSRALRRGRRRVSRHPARDRADRRARSRIAPAPPRGR